LDVLFLHATGFNAQTYHPLLDKLPATLAWDAWDLRGHGRCPLPADPAALKSWDTYADDVIAGLDARGAHNILLAGHSIGAVTALLIAAKRPDLAASVLMIDPPMLPPRFRFYAWLPGGIWVLRNLVPIAKNAGKRRAVFPDRSQLRTAYLGRGAFRTWQPDFLDAYIEGGTRPAAGGGVALCCTPAWEQATFTAFRHDAWRALTKITCPLVLLVAEKDSTVAAQLPRFQKLAPHALVETVAGTTHFIPMEKPELVRAKILGLLSRQHLSKLHPTQLHQTFGR
jgi:pimeloyl-ACP methyl ester carboxylesterase